MKIKIDHSQNTAFNIDKWSKTKNNNIIFITGHSGSGKTTLGENLEKKHKAFLFEIDGIEHNYDSSNKKILEQALNEYPKYKDIIGTKEWIANPNKYYKCYQEIFIEVLNIMKKDYRNLYIVEGLQIFWDMDFNIIKNQPLIIKNTSAIKSMLQRFKRNTGSDEIEWNEELKNNFLQLCQSYFISIIKMYIFKKKINTYSTSPELYTEFWCEVFKIPRLKKTHLKIDKHKGFVDKDIHQKLIDKGRHIIKTKFHTKVINSMNFKLIDPKKLFCQTSKTLEEQISWDKNDIMNDIAIYKPYDNRTSFEIITINIWDLIEKGANPRDSEVLNPYMDEIEDLTKKMNDMLKDDFFKFSIEGDWDTFGISLTTTEENFTNQIVYKESLSIIEDVLPLILFGEAFQISGLKNIYLTRNTVRADITSPIDKGSLYLFPQSKNTEDNIYFLNNIMETHKTKFAANKLKSVYIPRKINTRISNKMIIKTMDLNTEYEAYDMMTYKLKNAKQYNDKNIFMDTSIYFGLVEEKMNITKIDLVEDYLNAFMGYIEPFKHYPNKYIFIDPTRFAKIYTRIESFTMDKMYRKDPTFYTIFMYYLINETEKALEMFSGFTFIISTKNGLVKCVIDNLKELDEAEFKSEIKKLLMFSNRIIIKDKEESDDSLGVEEKQKENQTILTNIIDDIDPTLLTRVEEKYEDPIDFIDNTTKTIQDAVVNKTIDINKKPEESKEYIDAINNIYKAIDNEISRKKTKLTKREKEYLDKSNKDDKFSALKNTKKKIEAKLIPGRTLDKSINENRFLTFNEQYESGEREEILKNIIKHFNTLEMPLYFYEADLEDTSDKFNFLDTLNLKYNDGKGGRGSVKIKVPKLIEGRYFYLGGNKITLQNQLINSPIVKVGDDVIVTTIYNKLFIRYKNEKSLSPIESKLFRALEKINKGNQSESIVFGDYYEKNIQSNRTTLQYNRLSSKILMIKTDKLELEFRYDVSIKKYGDKGEDKLCIGKYDGVEIILDLEEELVHGHELIDGKNIDDMVMTILEADFPEIYKAIQKTQEEVDVDITPDLTELTTALAGDEIEDLKDEIDNIKTLPKNLASTNIKIIHRWIPMIYVLMSTHGLITTLKASGEKYDISYKVKPKLEKQKSKKPKIDKLKQMLVETKDAYLVIDFKPTTAISLFSPLNKLDLKDYTLAELENKNISARIMEDLYGSTNLILYLDNYRELLIDPETKMDLESLGLPTTFLDLMLYANMLLSTGKSTTDIDLNTKRLKHARIVESVLYSTLADAYGEYIIKKKRGNVKGKFEVNPKAVINALHALTTFEDYSTINPMNELTRAYTASMKGFSGINLDRAYTAKKIEYDKSFAGVIGLSSSYNANIGISKQLVLDPRIKNSFGEFNGGVANGMKELLTPSEAATPLTLNHDEPQRVAMMLSQTNQTMPVHQADPLLVSYGFDGMLPYLTVDFAYKAKDDGEVISIRDNQLTVKYSNGKTDVHILNVIERNSAKSFYTENYQLTLSHVTEGYKFNKGELLSYNPRFFREIPGTKEVVHTPGPMVYMALHSAPALYEDSIIISESLSNKASSDIIKRYSTKLKQTFSIKSYSKLGEDVSSLQYVFSYTEGVEDEVLAGFFDSSDDIELSKKGIKNKKHSKVSDIKVYYCGELESFSESIQEFIIYLDKTMSKYEKDLNKYGSNFDKQKSSRKAYKCKPGEMKLNDGEMLIEYYMKQRNIMSIGDKGTCYAAVKGIVADRKPDNMMPVSQITNKNIDLMIRSVSIGARKVTSVHIVGAINKALMKLGEDVRNIME